MRSLMRESGRINTNAFEFDPQERRYDILYYMGRLASAVFPDIEYILARETLRASGNNSLTEFLTRLTLIVRDPATIDRVRQLRWTPFVRQPEPLLKV
jgi:hypothetical protein